MATHFVLLAFIGTLSLLGRLATRVTVVAVHGVRAALVPDTLVQ